MGWGRDQFETIGPNWGRGKGWGREQNKWRNQDVAKDSNMECTCLALGLDLAQRELSKKGHRMPDHLSVKYDNTSREGKNQTVAKFLSWLQITGKFRSTQDGQGEKGHTHDALDQRFSVISSLLAKTAVLQTPEDFARRIQDYLAPIGERSVHVQHVMGVWDWQHFLEGLGFSYHGLAATAAAHDAWMCHSKRFVARRDMPQMSLPGWEIETPRVFQSVAPGPDDVIMCAKHFWSSPRLSQAPMLALPRALALTLPQAPTKDCPRNPLGEKQLAEYRRTAKKVAASPWRLLRAAEYLEKWCNQNEQQTWPQPRRLEWVVEPAPQGMSSDPVKALPDVLKDYAPQPPVAITITKASAKRVRLRGKWPRPAAEDDPPQVDECGEDCGAPVVLAEPQADIAEFAKVLPDSDRQEGVGLVLGCSKCRGRSTGCLQCRDAAFKGKRGPRRLAS